MSVPLQLKTAALSFALTCALLLVGLTVFSMVSGGGMTFGAALQGLGWKVVIWAALLVVLARWRPRLGWYIGSAAAAAALDALLSNLWIFTVPGAAFQLPLWITGILSFTAVAAIGCLLARTLLSRGPKAWSVALGLAMTIAGAVVLTLPYQWLRVYFTLGGTTPEPTDAQADTYAATAITAVVLAAASVVIAAVLRRTALTVLASVLLALTLLVGFVFQAPTGRWVPQPAPPAPQQPYTPCYGEGDPGCVGG